MCSEAYSMFTTYPLHVACCSVQHSTSWISRYCICVMQWDYYTQHFTFCSFVSKQQHCKETKRSYTLLSCLFQQSGLSKLLGNQLTPLHTIPPWAITIILCLLMASFTECTSNVATATLFLPILASMVSKEILMLSL